VSLFIKRIEFPRAMTAALKILNKNKYNENAGNVSASQINISSVYLKKKNFL